MPTPVKVALALAIVGALNWGLIGFFNWNLVDAIFGGDANEITSGASRVVYALVGLPGLASLYVFTAMTTIDSAGNAPRPLAPLALSIGPHSRSSSSTSSIVTGDVESSGRSAAVCKGVAMTRARVLDTRMCSGG